jgi:hypothetical protein
MFYPRITETELSMWTHWLPTAFVFERDGRQSLGAFLHRIGRLSAPQDVVEECRWAWTMDLFDAYELRTPARRDLRDPLVLGRLGTQHYRIALWGESLLPLEKITEIVQHSLTLRKRAVQWRTWSMLSGTLLGFAFGLWMAVQTPFPDDLLGISLSCAVLGFCCTGLPFQLYTPENRQQNFLDRYRR